MKSDLLAGYAALAPVIPVVTVEDPADAVPLARALVEAGLPVVEITLRTGRALQAMEAIARDVPDAVVAAGTVIRPEQIAQVVDAGAKFIVTPGTSRLMAEELAACALPCMPAAATVSEALDPRGARVRHAQVLSGRRVGRSRLAEGGVGADPAYPLLPDRRHRPEERPRLPRLPERGVRGRVLDGAAGRCRGPRLGTHRGACPRSRGAAGAKRLKFSLNRLDRVKRVLTRSR